MAQTPFRRLHRALHDGDSLNQIATIVEAHPEAVLFPENFASDSALRLACGLDRPLEIVQYLHDKHHEVSSSETPTKLPCLEAFSHDSDNAVDVAKFLVNNNPSYYAELSCNASGRHFAFRLMCMIHPRAHLMEFMVKKYPEAVTMTDRGGWLPLHLRIIFIHRIGRNIDSPTPEHDLGALVDAYPFALLAKTPDGYPSSALCIRRKG